MIISKLVEYYDRKFAMNNGLSEKLWPQGKVGAVIAIDSTGSVRSVNEGGLFQLPLSRSRSSDKTPNILYDFMDYIVGAKLPSELGKLKKKLGDRLLTFDDVEWEKFDDLKNAAFVELLDSLAEAGCDADDGFKALHEFCKKPVEVKRAEIEDKAAMSGAIHCLDGLVTFSYEDDPTLICHRNIVKPIVEALISDDTGAPRAVCLASGKVKPIRLKHGKVNFRLTSKCPLVSFSSDPFKHFGKDECLNAPIGIDESMKYVAALNNIVATNSVKVGAIRFAFWNDGCSTITPDQSEALDKDSFAYAKLALENVAPKDPDAGVKALAQALRSIDTGILKENGAKVMFHTIGFSSASMGRTRIDSYKVDTIARITENIEQHFNGMDIHGPRNEADQFGMAALEWINGCLKEREKADRMPSRTLVDTVKSILEGKQYPLYILRRVIDCIRNEGLTGSRARTRASIIKAYMSRKGVHEMTLGLNRENTHPAYRMGRFFAVVERAQARGPNRETLGGSYYIQASTRPNQALPKLKRLCDCYLKKCSKGVVIWLKKEIEDIFSGLDADSLPSLFKVDDQAMFALGYYQQSAALWSKKSKPTNETDTPKDADQG